MRTSAKVGLAALLVVGTAAGAYKPARDYWAYRYSPKWRQAEVTRGRVVSVVNATGTVKPVLSVRVGALVSGPVKALKKDFNDEVVKGELLAQIDDSLYRAMRDRDEAALSMRKAEVERVTALLQQAKNDELRAKSLHEKSRDFISQAELDQMRFKVESLKAELSVAGAAVKQAQANLLNSQTNLDYTRVISPVDGMVIDRKIDEGQALAATFQTPELFVVAPDLRKEIYVYVSVDETDIGQIRRAKDRGQPVQFAVDAYPDDLFTGVIHEIRLSSTELQNVVTYPVVVSAPNPDLKLLPGMTAGITFQIDTRSDVLKIPNAALRFYPEEKRVRKEDRKLLQGEEWEKTKEEDTPEAILSAEEKTELRRKRNRRHVWVLENGHFRAVEVVIGLSDSKFSELVSGDLKEGQKLVIGLDTSKD